MSLLNEWMESHGETPMTKAEIDAELAKGRRNARLRAQGLSLYDEIEHECYEAETFEREGHFKDCGIWYEEDCDCAVRWIGMEE